MTSRFDRSKSHPPTPILFVKIIVRTSLAQGKLKIPNNFTMKYGGGLPNPVFLKPPDGTEWEVYWTKHDGEVWFQKGWKEFATYYSLDHGHLVLFEYKETSHFELHIFDMGCLEINYPFHDTQDEKDKLDQVSDDSVEILDDLVPQPHKKLRSDTIGHVERSSNLQNSPQHVKTEGSIPFASVKKEMDGGEAPEGRALEEAMRFSSANPFFILKIKPSYFGRTRPRVPNDFMEKYINYEKQSVTLQFAKKLWPVKLLCYPYLTSGTLSSGWSQFAEKSKLQSADVCIFELINREDIVLDVHIFRSH